MIFFATFSHQFSKHVREIKSATSKIIYEAEIVYGSLRKKSVDFKVLALVRLTLSPEKNLIFGIIILLNEVFILKLVLTRHRKYCLQKMLMVYLKQN